jgi:hypothetical protein
MISFFLKILNILLKCIFCGSGYALIFATITAFSPFFHPHFNVSKTQITLFAVRLPL